MDVLNFSRRPRREFKPVPISSHSTSLHLSDRNGSNETDLFQGALSYIALFFLSEKMSDTRNFLEQSDKDVSRSIISLDVYYRKKF